jgi:hypothetical protein
LKEMSLPGAGSIFVGTQGVLVLPHIARPLLYPDKKFKDLKFPDVKEEIIGACMWTPVWVALPPPPVSTTPALWRKPSWWARWRCVSHKTTLHWNAAAAGVS